MKIEEKYVKFLNRIDLWSDSFFTNEFYHQCLHRAQKEKLFNKIKNIKLGMYGVGGESDKFLISENFEQRLVNGSRLSASIYNLISLVRHIAMVLARIYIDLKIITYSKVRYTFVACDCKRVVFIRSIAQARHASQRFAPAKNTVLFYAPSRLGMSQNLDSNVRLSYLNYFRELVSGVFKGKKYQEGKPIIDKIDFSFALREVNLASILQNQIHSCMKDLIPSTVKVIYTYEVLSKDALMDAAVASQIGAKCYHIRIVDVAFKETPYVVAGDRALVRSKQIEDAYRKTWIEDKSKFRKSSVFFGSNERKSIPDSDTILICTSPINLKLNRLFVRKVVEGNKGKKFHIRFHPRLRFDVKHLVSDNIIEYNANVRYSLIYTWPSSVIEEYWSEEVRINIFRPNINPYKHQVSHFYSLPNVVVVSRIDDIS